MAEFELTQFEADELIAMPKHRVDDYVNEYPGLGGAIQIPLTSSDRRHEFVLDVSRGRIDLKKGTYQNRVRKVIILVRLDFGGPPHRNPDGEELPCPHLHVYREGFGSKWAVPLPQDRFSAISDLSKSLDDFLNYCNVAKPWPVISRGLFL